MFVMKFVPSEILPVFFSYDINDGFFDGKSNSSNFFFENFIYRLLTVFSSKFVGNIDGKVISVFLVMWFLPFLSKT